MAPLLLRETTRRRQGEAGHSLCTQRSRRLEGRPHHFEEHGAAPWRAIPSDWTHGWHHRPRKRVGGLTCGESATTLLSPLIESLSAMGCRGLRPKESQFYAAQSYDTATVQYRHPHALLPRAKSAKLRDFTRSESLDTAGPTST